MIDYSDALTQILAQCDSPLSTERVELDASLGRIVAMDIRSDVNLPGFDNSAMDGFALDSSEAALTAGQRFTVVGEQAAGDASKAHRTGAIEIMTGAVVPAGLDTVVPVELTSREGDQLVLKQNIDIGANIRRAGEDIARGDLAVATGSRISAAQIMLLAALGESSLNVRRQPRAALFNTGRELVDGAAVQLDEGQIHNSNGPFLAARLATAGVELLARETLSDDIDEALAAIESAQALGVDLIITTGAVSMGRYDFIPELLARAGAETLFHKVSIRPGKPLLFARLPGGSLFFGLPGNPISAAVGLRFFVEPALRALYGLPPEPVLRVPLLNAARKRVGMRFFQKAGLQVCAGGQLGVRLLPGQESFRIQPLAASNAWAVLAEEADELQPGELVEVCGPGTFEPPQLRLGD